MKLKFLAILLLAVGFGMLAPIVNAEITAEFEDGGTAGVDTYPGIAGDGWRTGWDIDTTGTGTAAATLETSNPLYTGSNAYLSYSQADSSNNDGYSSGLSRRFYLTDLNDDYYISFSLRFDDITMWTDYQTEKTTSDYFYMSGTTDDNYNNDNTQTGWSVRMQGLKPDDSFLYGLQFKFLAGSTGTGSTTSEWSGFAIQEDGVYEMVINVHESDYTYEATVSEVGTTNSYTTTMPLNMISQVTTSYIDFITAMNSLGGENDFAYSIDNVRIANTPPVEVPEPGTIALLVSLLLAAGIVRAAKK
ncbi:MAG: PEP-CTERM sorting domain-containing protein [Planctomycetia bacterium]|jgi:hypothetical protein